MSVRQDHATLVRLKENPDFQFLQALLVKQGKEIIDSLKKAASKGAESSWRYYAGQMAGFEVAITLMDRAMGQMEIDIENDREKINIDEVLDNITKMKGE